jgi:hypothetical protein
MLRKIGIWAALAVAVFAANGCSSDDDGGAAATCNTNPQSCAAGTTCWLTANASFACSPAGPGAKGDACAMTLNAPCGEGLFCFDDATTQEPDGVCVSFCGADFSCGAGEACAQATLIQTGAQVRLCIPTQQPPPDGGTGGSAGTSGTGGAAGEAAAGGTAGESGSAGSAAADGG